MTAPEMPTDTPLLRVLRGLAADGYGAQFQAVGGGQVVCLTCRHRFPASQVPADRVTRLEGASDPDDMLLVVPLHCPSCATGGALVLQFGPEASAEDADVVAALDREHPREGGTPPSASSARPG